MKYLWTAIAGVVVGLVVIGAITPLSGKACYLENKAQLGYYGACKAVYQHGGLLEVSKATYKFW